MNNIAPQSSELGRYLAERQAPESFVRELLAHGSAEQAQLLCLIRLLRPSANTLRELVSMINEICRRDSMNWSTLFSDQAVIYALDENREANAKDRHRELKQHFTRLRYPETARIEAELENCKRTLKRDCGFALELPKDLEGEDLSITLRFANREELNTMIRGLSSLEQHPALEKIFQVLQGNFS